MATPTDFATTDLVCGIDVSHWDGVVDWNAVRKNKQTAANPNAPGVCFCYIKATEGLTVVDRMYATNIANTQAAGLFSGAYHFFLPQDDPIQQAKLFTDTVKTIAKGMLPPAVDLEVAGGMGVSVIADRLKAFLDAVANTLQVTPLIYTNPTSFWNPVLGQVDPSTGETYSSQFSPYYAWLAQYTDAAQPTEPSDLELWALWQFSDCGNVDGVAGPCDLIRFRESADATDAMSDFMHLVAS
jgi:lysozyme